MTSGIYLNGQPLDMKDHIDFQVIDEAFTFYYVYHPPAHRSPRKRALRRSPVRHLSALDLAETIEIQSWYE